MRRSAYAVSIAVAALLFAGCTSTATGTEAPVAGAASTQMPDPTPTPTPIASTDPDDPSTWVISDEGMGPFVLGMPFPDATAAAPGLEDACGHAYVRGSELWIGRGEEAETGLEVVAWWDAAGPETAEGIGYGSSTADVLTAFPDATVEYYNGYYLHAGNVYFLFIPDDDDIDANGALVEDASPSAIRAVAVTDQGSKWLYEYCG